MSNALAIINGCDETADCPADEHSSRCWRGYWESGGSENEH